MNWMKVLGAGVVAGIVVNLVDFVLHGIVLADTYARYPVFTEEEANPLWFFVISLSIFIFFAILFAKTRECWAAGVKGGATFGFWLGMVAFFGPFYSPLVLEGFPYFLAWCQGGINLIGAIVGGCVVALIVKR